MTQAMARNAAAVTCALVGLASLAGATVWAQAATDADLLPAVPRAAEIMPNAASTLTLDVVWNGERYVAVGDRGHVLLSNDGNEWVQVPVPVRAALTAVHFVSPSKGWAVGHDATVIHSSDGGRTWELQNFEPELEMPFHDVYFEDERRGIAVGAYGLAFLTEDGGATWEELDAEALSDDEFHINSITRLEDGSLFASGEFGLLAMAEDMAGPWQRLLPPYDSSIFGALPLKNGGVLIYGLRGNIFVADDLSLVPPLPGHLDMELMVGEELSGEGWRRVDSRTVNSMFGGRRLDDGTFLLVGLNGELLQLDENGDLIGAQQTRSQAPLAGAQPGPEGSLLLVGEAGIERFMQR